MLTSQVIPQGSGLATSTDYKAVRGSSIVISVPGTIPAGAAALVNMKTTQGYTLIGTLNATTPSYAFSGAATFQVVRQATGDAFAVDFVSQY